MLFRYGLAMNLDLAKRYVRAPNILASEVDRDTVLMSVDDGKYFAIDAIGSEIWRRLDHSESPGKLIEALKQHFDGEPDTIEREASAFLKLLLEERLIQLA